MATLEAEILDRSRRLTVAVQPGLYPEKLLWTVSGGTTFNGGTAFNGYLRIGQGPDLATAFSAWDAAGGRMAA